MKAAHFSFASFFLLCLGNFPTNQSPHRSNKLSSSGQVEEMYLIKHMNWFPCDECARKQHGSGKLRSLSRLKTFSFQCMRLSSSRNNSSKGYPQKIICRRILLISNPFAFKVHQGVALACVTFNLYLQEKLLPRKLLFLF